MITPSDEGVTILQYRLATKSQVPPLLLIASSVHCKVVISAKHDQEFNAETTGDLKLWLPEFLTSSESVRGV